MKTKSLLLATGLFISASAFAQKSTYKGVMLDDLGEPVIGATIQVKGVKGAGAITDLDGNFVINADANNSSIIEKILQNERVSQILFVHLPCQTEFYYVFYCNTKISEISDLTKS